MKTFLMKAAVAAVLFAASATAARAAAERTERGLRVESGGTVCEAVFYSPSIVRIVKYAAADGRTDDKSLAVVMAPGKVKPVYARDGGRTTVSAGGLRVVFDEADGTFSFYNPQGGALLGEGGFEIDGQSSPSDNYRLRQNFVLSEDDAVYGLGQSENGRMKQNGVTRELVQNNLDDAVPVIHSAKGYAVYWDNYSPTLFSSSDSAMSFASRTGRAIDYYFVYGGNADGVVAGLRQLTGEAPMLPLWAYGYWQSRERYKSQHELTEVVEKYRALGVPLDGIIQDWQYWGSNYLWNAMDFLTSGFYDARAMTDTVHALNAHVIISVWSSFGPMTLPYRELDGNGMLLHFKTWPESGLETWPPDKRYPSGVRVYDAFNPSARDIYWKYLNDGLFSKGIDGWWMDSTEPDRIDFTEADYDDPTFLGPYRDVCNAFPLLSVGGVYDHQRAVTSDKRVFILTRSAFAGQQRYGANTWTGDVPSTWETLRCQIPAGLNFSLTGNPQWNTDIGGFFAGAYNNSWNDGTAVKNPLFQELYVRWLQFGAFCPMMRSHGTEVPREIYYFGEKGEPVYDAIEQAIRLRYSLLPYIYSTAWNVSRRQFTFMRALFMDFPADKQAGDIGNEFMFGKALLVAPVVNAQYTPETAMSINETDGWNRENTGGATFDTDTDFTAVKSVNVYLPEGATWYDYFTGERFDGGQTVERQVTLASIPLFARAGSIVPVGPDVQYAEEKTWDEITLKVFPGDDGDFIFYDDEHDNYNYENGAFVEIPIHWNDRDRTLLFGKRQGSYEGMPQTIVFNVELPDGTTRKVDYSGKATKATLVQ